MILRGTVLVVGADRAAIKRLETALEDGSYAVLSTVGAEAPLIARAFRPDVILLIVGAPEEDSAAPEQDGAAICQRLRAHPLTAGIPIIAIAAAACASEGASPLPVNDSLRMPCDPERLYALIARWARAS